MANLARGEVTVSTVFEAESEGMALQMGHLVRGFTHTLTEGGRGIATDDGSLAAITVMQTPSYLISDVRRTSLDAATVSEQDGDILVAYESHEMTARDRRCDDGFCGRAVFRVGKGRNEPAEVVDAYPVWWPTRYWVARLRDAEVFMRGECRGADPIMYGQAAVAAYELFTSGHLLKDDRLRLLYGQAVVEGIKRSLRAGKTSADALNGVTPFSWWGKSQIGVR